MAIKVKKGGIYTDPVGIFAKKAGLYSAVTEVSAKEAGAYVSVSNLYKTVLAEDGFIYDYATGTKTAFATGIASGKIPVREGNNYTISLPSSERGLLTNVLAYSGVAGSTYLGLAAVLGGNPVVSGMNLILGPAGAGSTGGRQFLTFTVPVGSGITHVATGLLYYYEAHTNADFIRIRDGVRMYSTVFKTDGGRISVTRAGNSVYVRGAFDGTNDILQMIQLASGSNNTVNVMGARKAQKTVVDDAAAWTAGTSLAAQGDDTAPIQINGTYIGGNHGAFIVQEITATAHGKTVADVGSEWTDGVARKWYLMKVIDANKLWFVSENLSVYPTWSFATAITGATLTHSGGATHTGSITVAGAITTQLWPCLQSQTAALALNGVVPITDDGNYLGTSLDVVNTYKIANPASVLAFVRAQVGSSVQPSFIEPSIAADVDRTLTYRYFENGSCEIIDGLKMINAQTLNYFGSTQAAPLTYSGKQLWQYIPRVTPKTGTVKTWDFQAQEDISGTFESLSFGSANWSDLNNPPDRMAQIVKTSGVAEFGLMLGYSPVRSVGVPETRKTLVNDACFLSSARKQYPKGMNIGPLVADAYYEIVAFRTYWSAAAQTAATTFAWYRDRSDVIVVADFHQNVSMSLLKLPQHLVGMSVAVVDKSASATVHSTVLDTSGISVSITGGYGYVVLKLS